jgi:hypothetical protein
VEQERLAILQTSTIKPTGGTVLGLLSTQNALTRIVRLSWEGRHSFERLATTSPDEKTRLENTTREMRSEMTNFNYRKTPVITSPTEFREFIRSNQDKFIMGYIGKKESSEWARSTSRVHMNIPWEKFIYLPINIIGRDNPVTKEYYDIAMEYENVLGFNHTKSHKSNIYSLAKAKGARGDIMIKENGKWVARSSNGTATVKLAKHMLQTDSLSAYRLVTVGGLGGAGRLICEAMLLENPVRIYVVDPASDNDFIAELTKAAGKTEIIYVDVVDSLPVLDRSSPIIFVDASHHYVSDDTGIRIEKLLRAYDDPGNAAIDLLMSKIVFSPPLGMHFEDGLTYVAWTNYELSQIIEEWFKKWDNKLVDDSAKLNIHHIEFEEFDEYVKYSEEMANYVV